MDRRKRRTRKLLGDALLKLVLEKDFEQITIQDITDEADLNRATFYLHFGSKEELLAHRLTAYFDELTERIDQETASESIWENETAVAMVFEHVAENADLYKVLLGKKGLGYVINRIINYIAEYNSAEMRQCVDTTNLPIPLELVSQHFAGSLYATLLWWLEHDMPYTPMQMSRMSKQLCMHGTLPTLAPFIDENLPNLTAR